MKAISAAQDAAKSGISKAIYQRTKDEQERARLLNLLHNDPTADSWLHRVFREQYQRGHTYVRNQIVYQSQGYTCKRLTRNTVQLEVAGLVKGKPSCPESQLPTPISQLPYGGTASPISQLPSPISHLP